MLLFIFPHIIHHIKFPVKQQKTPRQGGAFFKICRLNRLYLPKKKFWINGITE